MTPEQFLDVTRRATFHKHMSQYAALHDAGRGDEDDALELLGEALSVCPPEFKPKLDEIIKDVFGEMPQPEFCDDNGNPCYTQHGYKLSIYTQ